MFRQSLMKADERGRIAVATALVLLCVPAMSLAWGNNAQRLIINHAVDTLPSDARGFFEANRGSATGVNRESIDFVTLAIGQLMWGAGLTTVLMWKGASTPMDGLKIGATVGLLFFLGFDLTMYATTHLSNLVAALVDALAATALFAVTGAVIALVTAPKR